MKLKLRELALGDEGAFFEGLKDWEGEELFWYTFDWQPGVKFSDLLKRLSNNSKGVDLPEDWVPSTMYYGFVDGEIVGRVHVRHCLNENLAARGGHIGYAVAPRHRKKGYASEMVKQVLPFCRRLGLDKILITCAVNNKASCKIIESIGGRIEDEAFDEIAKEMMRKYWVSLA